MPLNGPRRIFDDHDALYDALAASIITAANEAIESRGVFHLALSGGSTPERFYMHLVIDPDSRHFPWRRTHLWQVDERHVSQDDLKSNFRMIRESLVDHVPLPEDQIHPIPVDHSDPAGAYEQSLRHLIPGEPVPQLDYILLGLGEDGHTAGLFPGSPAIDERDRLVVMNDGPTVTPPARITMTFALINTAAIASVLVTGKRKADILRKISNQFEYSGPDPARLPITGITPASDSLHWYMDTEAAGLLV